MRSFFLLLMGVAALAGEVGGADKNRNLVSSGRFVLRFDEREVAREEAARMVEALGEEFARIDLALGCGFQEQVYAVAETLDSYRAATGAAEWSGGRFDGQIRVALPERTMSPQVRRALAHELVHACLARQGQFPLWFHEGMAQRWSGERAPPAVTAEIRSRLRAGQIPGLAQLSSEWAHLSLEHARLAYALALAAVERLYLDNGEDYVRSLIRDPDALSRVAERLNAKLSGN